MVSVELTALALALSLPLERHISPEALSLDGEQCMVAGIEVQLSLQPAKLRCNPFTSIVFYYNSYNSPRHIASVCKNSEIGLKSSCPLRAL